MKTTTATASAFDRGVQPILEIILPGNVDALVNFKPDLALQQRIEVLASKSTEGELSDDERAEYEGYVHANKFVSIICRQARRMREGHG